MELLKHAWSVGLPPHFCGCSLTGIISLMLGQTLAGAETPAVQTVDFINEVYTEMLQRLKVNRLQRTGSLNTVDGTAAYSLAAEVNARRTVSRSTLSWRLSAATP